MKSDFLFYLGCLFCVSHAARRRKVCPGLQDPDYVNYSNIRRFKGCTKINGNIIINDATFHGSLGRFRLKLKPCRSPGSLGYIEVQTMHVPRVPGDPYLNLMGLHPDALNVFRDVQDITGFLVVQGNHPDFTNLSFFKNLIRIRGKKTLFRNSLTIAFTTLKYLGLTSLKTIQRGNVMIASNKDLCYVDSVEFRRFFRRSRKKRQKAIVKRNKSVLNCENAVCSLRCSTDGCWGPGYRFCVKTDRRFSNLIDDMLQMQSFHT